MVNRWGRASQCPAEPAAATSVRASATSASLDRRATRNSKAKVSARTRLLANTTAAIPACRCSQPNSTSHSHSQANHGCPDRVKEKISRSGTRPCARIHSPVRRCQPVSPSPNRVCAPFMPQNRKTSGITKAASVMEGSHRKRREGLDGCMRRQTGKGTARAKEAVRASPYLPRFQFAFGSSAAGRRCVCTNRRRVSGIETLLGPFTVDGNLTNSGTLSTKLFGGGTLGYNVVDAGILSPGNSVATTGKLTVADTYTQSAAGALDIAINGAAAGTNYDQLKVTQCGSAATSVIHSRAFSSCSTLSVRFLFHKQDHNRRTPCKSLSRNTKTRFKDR